MFRIQNDLLKKCGVPDMLADSYEWVLGAEQVVLLL